MFLKKMFPLMEGEPGASGGGSTPPAGDSGSTPPAGDSGTPPANPPSALAAGAPDPAAPPAPGPNDWVPEKFRVMKEDGSLDLEASARKVEEHRSNLEKRLGAGDIPPKSPSEYKLNIDEKYKDLFKAEDLAKDPALTSFLEKAHAEGMTQKGVDLFLNEWFERSSSLLDAKATMDAEACTNALKEVWKTDTEFKANNQAAYRAAKEYGGDQFDAILNKYGNDPQIIQMLARIGKELGEDSSASAEARGKTDAQNMQDEHAALAAWVNDPKNQKTGEFDAKNRRYNELSKLIWGDSPRRSGSIAINTV